MTSVSSFLYRLPRFSIHFPVEFVRAHHITVGLCQNLSHTGLLARFTYPLPEGATGTLRLKPIDRTFDLLATVTHADGLTAGLHFLFTDREQEHVIRAVVEAVSHHPAPPIS